MNSKYTKACLYLNYTILILEAIIVVGTTYYGFFNFSVLVGGAITCFFPFCMIKVIKTDETKWYVVSFISYLAFLVSAFPVILPILLNPMGFFAFITQLYNIIILIMVTFVPSMRIATTAAPSKMNVPYSPRII